MLNVLRRDVCCFVFALLGVLLCLFEDTVLLMACCNRRLAVVVVWVINSAVVNAVDESCSQEACSPISLDYRFQHFIVPSPDRTIFAILTVLVTCL